MRRAARLRSTAAPNLSISFTVREIMYINDELIIYIYI